MRTETRPLSSNQFEPNIKACNENSSKRSLFSLLDFTEKKSSKKAESAQAVKLNKTFAPIFLKGLTDLKVMDGSQVIMTVEVSGT